MRAAALLGGVSIVFVAAFFVQRARSPFLAVEARSEEAATIAAEHGVEVADVLALHESAGGRLDVGVLRARVGNFVRMRREFGHEGLAVLALAGHVDAARALQGLPAAQLEGRIRALPAGIVAVRFAAMKQRFAERRAAMD